MPIPWRRLVARVKAIPSFILTSHLRPDADALGSELGMAACLTALGKQVRIVNADGVPPSLKFLDPTGKIEKLGDPAALNPSPQTAIWVLDTSAWAQLGTMGQVLRNWPGPRLVLDHHVSSDDLGAEVFKDVHAEATGRLIAEFARYAKVPLTAEMAVPLFAAIATDTGWFRFNSVKAGTYRTLAKLVKAGAEPPTIYRELYEQDSPTRLQLISRILSRVDLRCEGRLISAVALASDFNELGAVPADTEDIVNMLLRVKGTLAAAMFVELPEGGRFKISLRSRTPEVDCTQIAEQFGGGGHRAAAGLMQVGAFAEVQRNVLGAFEQQLNPVPVARPVALPVE